MWLIKVVSYELHQLLGRPGNGDCSLIEERQSDDFAFSVQWCSSIFEELAFDVAVLL